MKVNRILLTDISGEKLGPLKILLICLMRDKKHSFKNTITYFEQLLVTFVGEIYNFIKKVESAISISFSVI